METWAKGKASSIYSNHRKVSAQFHSYIEWPPNYLLFDSPVKVLTGVVSWAQTMHALCHDSHSQHVRQSHVRVATGDSDTCLFGKSYWHLTPPPSPKIPSIQGYICLTSVLELIQLVASLLSCSSVDNTILLLACIIEASLNKRHTSVTALYTVRVCLLGPTTYRKFQMSAFNSFSKVVHVYPCVFQFTQWECSYCMPDCSVSAWKRQGVNMTHVEYICSTHGNF